jgi:hypothetical protein
LKAGYAVQPSLTPADSSRFFEQFIHRHECRVKFILCVRNQIIELTFEPVVFKTVIVNSETELPVGGVSEAHLFFDTFDGVLVVQTPLREARTAELKLSTDFVRPRNCRKKNIRPIPVSDLPDERPETAVSVSVFE